MKHAQLMEVGGVAMTLWLKLADDDVDFKNSTQHKQPCNTDGTQYVGFLPVH